MLGASNDFYNFIIDSYHVFKKEDGTTLKASWEMYKTCLLYTSMYVTLNDFYYELGLDGTKMGNMLGWNIDKGYIDLAFSSQLDANGTPCLVIRCV